MFEESCAAIVLAAGKGSRMNSDVAKQYMLIDGKPLVYYSLKAFQESFVDEIVLVVAPGEIDYVREEIVRKYDFDKVSDIVEGGRERYHSVNNGLQAIRRSEYVMIHDGARPFVNDEIINAVMENVLIFRAADILLYDADYVPCGKDQKQHVEYARDFAEKFNREYGETFKIPEPLIDSRVATIIGSD